METGLGKATELMETSFCQGASKGLLLPRCPLRSSAMRMLLVPGACRVKVPLQTPLVNGSETGGTTECAIKAPTAYRRSTKYHRAESALVSPGKPSRMPLQVLLIT